MLVDFHTHTRASDGALTPGELLERAAVRGVRLLAITDHDTVAGYRAARELCTGIADAPRLVAGVEFSCRWSGATVHIVGLGIDCDHPAMSDGLGVLAAARTRRGVRIGERLAERGFAGALDGALAEAGDSQLGRPHFAAWMIRRGHVPDARTAFARFLGRGRAGDVMVFWPELAQVVDWIESSGGAAVVAHPAKYGFTGAKLRRLLADFAAAGGSGIEIACGHQTPEQSHRLRRYAREFDLEISVGSDFHRDAPYGPALGVDLPRADGLRGVWERWVA